MKRFLAALLMFTMLLSGCGATEPAPEPAQTEEQTAQEQPEESSNPKIPGLTYKEPMKFEYAVCLTGDYYEDGYVALYPNDGRKYLVVPENGEVPSGIDDYIILQQPFENIYQVATAGMCFFDAMDKMDAVRLSGTKEDSWYIPSAVEKMKSGDILYAGKYSAPDYELICAEKCDLSIQSSMIYHSPETLEKLEELNIPVFVDRSGYEDHPLGRTEWIKVYGALLNCREKAEALFEEQKAEIEPLKDLPSSGKSVVYFYVQSDGAISVRKGSDYFAKMIDIAGGEYVYKDLEDGTASSSVSMTMEEFYATAKDADYILYNNIIDHDMKTMEQFLSKSPLFADFKAVKEGNVWCTGKYIYQASNLLGTVIKDINLMVSGEEDMSKYHFIYKLK